MAITNHERVGKALELLKAGLGPFVEREVRNAYQDRAPAQVARLMGEDRLLASKPLADWDAAGLLKLMWEAWNDVFGRTLGRTERSLVSELRDRAGRRKGKGDAGDRSRHSRWRTGPCGANSYGEQPDPEVLE
jgi:hypothetical protein